VAFSKAGKEERLRERGLGAVLRAHSSWLACWGAACLGFIQRGRHHHQQQHTDTHYTPTRFPYSSSRDGDECRVHWELGVEHDGGEFEGFRLLGGACPLCANPGACRHGPLQGLGVSGRVDGKGESMERVGGVVGVC